MKTEIIIIKNKSKWNIPKQSKDKFFDEAIDWNSDDQNFKYPFKTMTSKYGIQFIEYCKAMWIARDEIMTVEKFCNMNANMPIGFFKNKIQ